MKRRAVEHKSRTPKPRILRADGPREVLMAAARLKESSLAARRMSRTRPQRRRGSRAGVHRFASHLAVPLGARTARLARCAVRCVAGSRAPTPENRQLGNPRSSRRALARTDARTDTEWLSGLAGPIFFMASRACTKAERAGRTRRCEPAEKSIVASQLTGIRFHVMCRTIGNRAKLRSMRDEGAQRHERPIQSVESGPL